MILAKAPPRVGGDIYIPEQTRLLLALAVGDLEYLSGYKSLALALGDLEYLSGYKLVDGGWAGERVNQLVREALVGPV